MGGEGECVVDAMRRSGVRYEGVGRVILSARDDRREMQSSSDFSF